MAESSSTIQLLAVGHKIQLEDGSFSFQVIVTENFTEQDRDFVENLFHSLKSECNVNIVFDSYPKGMKFTQCECNNVNFDQNCVFDTLKKWERSDAILCLGCFTGFEKSNKVLHECLMSTDYLQRQVQYILSDSCYLQELFSIYNESHLIHGIDVKCFEIALNKFYTSNVSQVIDEFLDKERAGNVFK